MSLFVDALIESLVSLPWKELLWAFIGALFGLALYISYENFIKLRATSDLFGEWNSTWQPTVRKGWGWVTEKVTIYRGLGTVRLRNHSNSEGLRWIGKGQLIDDTYLLGQWKSALPGANGEGVFVLTFAVNGRSLLGYFLSRDVDSGKFATGFVLGRSEADMEAAKLKLERMRIRFPKTPKTKQGVNRQP